MFCVARGNVEAWALPRLDLCHFQALKSRRNEESLAHASGEQELAWRPWFSKKSNFKACAPGLVGRERASMHAGPHVTDTTTNNVIHANAPLYPIQPIPPGHLTLTRSPCSQLAEQTTHFDYQSHFQHQKIFFKKIEVCA